MRDGLVVLSGNCCVPAHAAMRGTEFTSCPVAMCATPSVGDVLSAWRAYDAGQMALIEPNPSAALMAGVDLISTEIEALKTYNIDAAKRKRKGG